jgi:type IV pilus assembly protein PilW
MNHMTDRRPNPGPRAFAHHGFSLVELMIAITIAIFLTGALLTLVQAMKATSGVQGGLSQLQDNERMAMTLMTDVIQQAGYFPNPSQNTALGEFLAIGPLSFAGQSISLIAGQSFVGAGNYGDPPPPAASNSITVRYATAGTAAVAPAVPDSLINCSGNTTSYATTFTNTFSVVADPSVPGTYDLVCQLLDSTSGAVNEVYLVSGVTQMQIYYGVKTNSSINNNSVDAYLDANTITAANEWTNVISVKVTLTFVNPLYGNLAGQNTNADTPQTIAFTRVIDIMNKTGGATT